MRAAAARTERAAVDQLREAWHGKIVTFPRGVSPWDVSHSAPICPRAAPLPAGATHRVPWSDRYTDAQPQAAG